MITILGFNFSNKEDHPISPEALPQAFARGDYCWIDMSCNESDLYKESEVDDRIFREVAELTRDILAFRKIVLDSREIMHEIATRRSPFIPETTQPYLEKMADTLERMEGDITTERDSLSESLNLYMGMVSHRTNKVVNRLTAISAIFLPLTFLCGVYGMNFEVIPELSHPKGYLFFWVGVLLISSTMLVFMKRRKWL